MMLASSTYQIIGATLSNATKWIIFIAGRSVLETNCRGKCSLLIAYLLFQNTARG